MSWQDILKNEMDVKTLEEIATELEKAVKAHASQAKRIRDMLAKTSSSSRPQPPSVRPRTRGDELLIDRATRTLREQNRNN